MYSSPTTTRCRGQTKSLRMHRVLQLTRPTVHASCTKHFLPGDISAGKYNRATLSPVIIYICVSRNARVLKCSSAKPIKSDVSGYCYFWRLRSSHLDPMEPDREISRLLRCDFRRVRGTTGSNENDDRIARGDRWSLSK